ncbi:MAG: adenine phosphoribosyltransferase [Candidatus Firestonebacteria bacterium]
MKEIAELIVDVVDFPKKGIVFKDITPLLINPEAVSTVIDNCVNFCKDKGINKVVAMESRGFLLGVPVSMGLKVGFVPVRKPGKLPRKTVKETYTLEYGTDTVEMHEDAIKKGDKVLIVDDVLATGGTAEAVVKLVEKCGGEVVHLYFLIELVFLNGAKKLKDYKVKSLIKYHK